MTPLPNLRFLQTLLAIAEQPSFAAAGDALGLSPSAVSLQVKALEEGFGAALVDRTRRPPRLTARGLALAEQAHRIFDVIEEMSALGDEDTLAGALSIGVAPSALVHLAPPALAALRAAHPKLTVQVRSALSDDLAQAVRSGELDVAVSTEPEAALAGLHAAAICREPLFAVGPIDAPERDVKALLTARPFIWFNRRAWAGRRIEQAILAEGIRVRAELEADSLEAVTSLVRHGLGVSVLPQRTGAPPLAETLTALPFGEPQLARGLVLLERAHNPKTRLTAALLSELRAAALAARPPERAASAVD